LVYFNLLYQLSWRNRNLIVITPWSQYLVCWDYFYYYYFCYHHHHHLLHHRHLREQGLKPNQLARCFHQICLLYMECSKTHMVRSSKELSTRSSRKSEIAIHNHSTLEIHHYLDIKCSYPAHKFSHNPCPFRELL